MKRCITSVTLRVADLKRSVWFYADLLGFRVLKNVGGVSYLGVDGADDPLVILQAIPGATRKPPRTTGLYHVAILLPNRRELARLFRRLTLANWPFLGFSDHGVSEALYLTDPDGNGLELYADRPASDWTVRDGQVHMTTEALDLDDLVMEIQGESKQDIVEAALPAETMIGHIHLHVSDLQTAEDFFVGLLGFDVMLRTYPGALFVASGGYHHHLGLNVWAGVGAPAPPANAVGLTRFSLRPPNGQEPTLLIDRLRHAQYEIAEEDPGWVIRDPFGIELAIEGSQ